MPTLRPRITVTLAQADLDRLKKAQAHFIAQGREMDQSKLVRLCVRRYLDVIEKDMK